MSAPTRLLFLFFLLSLSAGSIGVAAAQGAPLRVTIRAGVKTHGPGQHDHPRLLEEWSTLLTRRGCEVRGSLEFPSAEDLEATDVLVFYAADGGSIHGDERQRLEAYLARGGGIVVLHDAVCGDDPHWFKTVVGGAWEHGHSKWHEGEIGLYFADREHPITRGVSNFDLQDEIYHELHLMPEAQILANSFHTPFDVAPQMWTYEKDDYRAFVSLQGHEWTSFSHPAWRTLLLRGIAWAAKRDADSLVVKAETSVLRYPEGGPRAPDVAHEPFELHPDFELSLVAHEPLIVNPISVDWDPAGRMWVALTPSYPYKEKFDGTSEDSIAILTDADGDGVMDTKQVFHEGLDLVTSLVFHQDGVIVTAAPDILWLRDTDGDDVADEVQTLYTGFGYGDTHATISNMRRGLDGWIYATQGYSGGGSNHVIGVDGTDHGRIPNGICRFKPDGTKIEQVASYGSNTWGLDFTVDGELFFTMANGSHLRHLVVPDKAFANGRIGNAPSWVDITDHKEALPISKHDRPPYQQIDFVGGFTAAAGSLIYTGGAWPEEFEGNHFVCEPTINLVHRDVIEPDGVTFKATRPRDKEFLASTDLWFRPVHLRVGPDGAMYVLDFYNQAAVHNDTRGPQHGPTNAAVRPDRDRLHGRIWRVQHGRAKVAEVQPLGELDDDALLAHFGHPNRWVSRTVRRLLVERLPGEEILKLLGKSKFPGEDARLAATLRMSAAIDFDEVEESRWLPTLWHKRGGMEPDARERLIRILDWDGYVPGPHDDRQPTDFPQEWLDLYAGSTEDWTRSAILNAAAQMPERALKQILTTVERDPSPYVSLVEKLVNFVADGGDDARSAKFFELLSANAPSSPRLAAAGLSALADVWTGNLPTGSAGAVQGLLQGGDLDVAIAAVPFARRLPEGARDSAQLEKFGARLAEIISEPGQELNLRLRCLRSLLALPEQREAAIREAERFLDPYFPSETQLEVVRLLDDVNEPAAAGVLIASYPKVSGKVRERALQALVQRSERAEQLLEALAAGELRVADLGTGGLHRLRNHADPAIAERMAAFDAERGAGSEDVQVMIAELLPQVTQTGDAENGRVLFEANCGTCHAIDGVGGNVGPALDGMGAHGAAELLPIILDPNRAIEAAYLEYQAETVDGRNVAGVIVREDARRVVLRSSAGEEELRRDEIESLESTGRSPMPVGFESLGAEGLRDLLTYLARGTEGFRLLDLESVCTASTERGLYDERRDAKAMRFQRYGVVDVEGVPFEVLDARRTPSGNNALVLKGGMAGDWDSKLKMPQRVEVPVGYPLTRLHVLGGISAWGHPFTQDRAPAVKLTWVYADGAEEEHVMTDGMEFADWIRRHDVPGSRWVPVLDDGSWGQMRMFHVDPERTDVAVERLVLESFDNQQAPTFLALTAQTSVVEDESVEATTPRPAPKLLVVGGGSSHDFHRWFHGRDLETLSSLELGPMAYTELPSEIGPWLEGLEVLVLTNNQPLSDPELRRGIFDYVERGGGLVLVHPAIWYNWGDWPEYNARLVGGGARSHENYGTFEVARAKLEHPILEGVPGTFRIDDELYRFEPDPDGAEIQALAVGHSLSSGESYPVVWTVEPASKEGGRIVAITLGHDGAAHEHEAFQTLLRNAVQWVRPE